MDHAEKPAIGTKTTKALLVYLLIVAVAVFYSIWQSRAATHLAASTRTGCINFHHDMQQVHAMHAHDIASLRAALLIRPMNEP